MPARLLGSHHRSATRALRTGGHRVRFRRLRWLTLLLGVVTLSLVAAKGHDPRSDRELLRVHNVVGLQRVDLPLPEGGGDGPVSDEEMANWQVLTVAPGDSAARLLSRADITGDTIHQLVNASEHGHELGRLHPGEQLRIHRDAQGDLVSLVHEISPERSLRFDRNGNGFDSQVTETPLERRTEYVTGTIEYSLMAAGAQAGLSDRITMELASIFAWDIDFALDLRRGDRFIVVYEALYHHGTHVRDGAVLAAEFVNQGRSHQALRYTDPEGRVDYFAPDGTSTRRAFLRAPVEYTRITSGFGPRRHPKLHKMRRHNGVDYAAPTGTPIRATADGRIVRHGWQGGYGRTVVIQHGDRYSTLYAHLSRFRDGRGVGARVQQGDIIGYIGQSGLATGPHIHYEFLIDRVHHDPQTVELPKGDPVAPELRPHFATMTAPLADKLATLGQAHMPIAQR